VRDFTLKSYGELLSTIMSDGFPVFGVATWLRLGNPIKGAVMRHDVDRRPQNALAMAKLEHERGIRTTYYFRVVGSAYCEKTILAIADLGHEIGYHYEDLSLAKGDKRLAVQLFEAHIADLRRLVPIETVTMHGSPLSRHHNLDMWSETSLRNFGLLGDAFLSVDYQGMLYFTDTGRGWNRSNTNLRDRPPGIMECSVDGDRTADLIGFLRAHRSKKLAFSVHPERWNDYVVSWGLQLISDSACNAVKSLVKRIQPASLYRR
jgi:hypothetical protein